MPAGKKFISRAGEKLEHALTVFGFDVTDKTCADFGAQVGGFTACLLAHGATRVYSVDTAYGALDWTLRQNPRVVIMERTNAMHVQLPAPADLIAIDVGWTRLDKIVPNAVKNLRPGGDILALVKIQYEAEATELRQGHFVGDVAAVLSRCRDRIHRAVPVFIPAATLSPLRGEKGDNPEYFFRIQAPVQSGE